MNKKQIVSLWIGIVLIVAPALFFLLDSGGYIDEFDREQIVFKLALWTFAVLPVVGGLIYSFRGSQSSPHESNSGEGRS